MNDIKISVIVPVYNGEKWLNRCLGSLVNQTLEEIQIICVNDCSTDNSLAILQQYAKKDKRIIVKNLKKNCGESVARNNGLKIAKGEYVAFVDQDDYVDLDFYKELYNRTKNGSIDIVKGNVKIKEKGVTTIPNLNSKIISNKFYFNDYWWSAIYKNSILQDNNIRLRENIILGADLIFLTEAIVNANNVMVIDNVFYNYIKRVNSGDSKILNCKKINSAFQTRLIIFDYLNLQKISKKNYIIVCYGNFTYSLSLFNRCNAKKDKELVCEKTFELYEKFKYKQFLKENLYEELFSCLRNKDKIGLFSFLTQIPDIGYPEIKLTIQKKYIYVWGKGKDSESVVWQCKKNNWNIAGFLDSNEKIGTISPFKILKRKNKNYFIIISSRRYCDEIVKICKKAGLREWKDFWRPS